MRRDCPGRLVRFSQVLAIASAAGLAAPLLAQDQPALPVIPSHEVPVMISTGELVAPPDADAVERTTLFETIVHAPGAAWLRLVFAPAPHTALSGDPAASNASVVRITSLHDGHAQTLTAEHLEHWSFTSAYFNGDALKVEVLGAAGTGPSRLVILSAIAGAGATPSTRSLCETADDRELSFDPRAARLMPIGCTAWLFNDLNSTFLTAGHCTVTSSSVVQFNVPLSTAAGNAQHPPPEDQYPVELASNQGTGSGTGNDWRYFACFPNSTTGLTAYQRQQARYVLAPAAPPMDSRTIRITGYGTVSSPVPQTWRLVQKTHTGPYSQVSGNLIRYHVDTTGGNSGSAVLDEDNNMAIGIHTHAGCNNTPTSSNQGTAIHHPGLQAALAAPRGLCASGRGTPGGNLFVSGDLNNSFGTLDRATGQFAKLATAPGLMQGLAYDQSIGMLRAVDNANKLYNIDPATGDATFVTTITGVTGNVNSLACDPRTSVLYGMIQTTGQLVRINPETGEAANIGIAAGGNIGALEFDPVARTLFAIDDPVAGSRLVRIRPTDGVRTIIGGLGAGIVDCNGLAWSDEDRALYTINAATEQLLRVDRTTGVAAVVGPTGGIFGSSFGMAAVWNPISNCVADFNVDGSISVQDIFDFLAAWFSLEESAEMDGFAGLSTEDVFVFLQNWFLGCG